MKKNIFIGVAGVLAILIVSVFVLNIGTAKGFENVNSFEGNIDIYKSQTCGCCAVYSRYFESKGNSNVNVIDSLDLDGIKQQYGVPSAMNSCHTTIIDGYFVEGHVPLEAVEKLLKERPDIKGIAMPGMPEGSPGMPGNKRGDFVIYAVNNDGDYEEWMRI